MKTWQEICKKYKGTELLWEFCNSIHRCKLKEDMPALTYKHHNYINRWNIKDVYGYLFCFAKSEYDYDLEKTVIGSFNVSTPEELMLYRTEKFFSSEFEEAK